MREGLFQVRGGNEEMRQEMDEPDPITMDDGSWRWLLPGWILPPWSLKLD